MRDLTQLPTVTPELLLGSTPLPSPAGPVRVSLGAAPARERPGLLQECFTRLGFTYEVDPLRDATVEADVVLHSLPGLKMAAGRLHGSRNRRTRALTEDGTDDIGLIINVRGPHLITQGKHELVLGDGDATFLSCSDPCSLTHRPPGDVLTLRVPRAQFAPLVNGVRDRCVRRITSDAPALALLTNYADLAWTLPAASREVQHLVVAHVYDLMAVIIGATRDAAETAQGRGLRAARLHAIKQDIARHLDQPGLSVATLAARHGCTPRCVQRLFETEGTTFTEYVLAQRLVRAHRMLSDPRREGEKISVIAYDSGFGDVSYFNRVFRRHFGAAPSDIRAQACHAAPDRLM
jgi:AraC-like DNA-binding protein